VRKIRTELLACGIGEGCSGDDKFGEAVKLVGGEQRRGKGKTAGDFGLKW
jgi:hypothetical protein